MAARNLIRLIAILAVLLASAATFQRAAAAGRLGPSLERRMETSSPVEMIPVIIRPKGALAGASLKREVALAYATRREQHRLAVEKLQSEASATQPSILAALKSTDFAGRVSNVRGYWIDNVITADMSSTAIAELTMRDDIDEIVLLPEVSWVDPIPVPDALVPTATTGAAQPGLRAIKADSLWRLGYTGKGRLVASIDLGVDGKHFALSGSWRGHNGYSVRESWFDPQQNDSVPHTFPGAVSYHGTSVMGIMVARDTLVTMDTLGVCFDAQWISAAAIDVTGTSILEALQWVADPDGDPNTEEDVPDVVNNSWGISLSSHSGQYDTTGSCNDIFWNAIDNVEAAGAAMIFAAGNEGPHAASIRNPANRVTSETNAFSVGMADASIDGAPISLHQFSSRGPSTCDMTSIKPEVIAPGAYILTTIPGNNFTSSILGTSFATPHVAGAIALLREYNPNATVDTIKWALLHGARDMGTPGPDNDWGHGFLDLMGALRLMPVNSSPALYIKRDQYARPAPGNSTSLVITLRSQGPSVSNVNVTLVSEDPRLTVLDGAASFGDFFALGDTASNAADPFVIAVSQGALPGERLAVRFEISGSAGYNRSLRGVILVGPATGQEVFTHDAANFRLSVSSFGTFGLQVDGLSPRYGGQGYFYGSDSTQSLFEGAFLVGIDSQHVSNNARESMGFPDADFEPDPEGFLAISDPGTAHAEETRAAYTDALAERPMGLFIEQHTFVDTTLGARDYLVAEYKIHNRSGSTLQGVRAGLYFDWDFPWNNPTSADSGGYDPATGTGWMKQRGENRYRGLLTLTNSRTTSYRYLQNVSEVYDGFTDGEKWRAMSEGFVQTAPPAFGDGSQLIATGPLSILPDSSITVAFAIIGASTRPQLLASAIDALVQYSSYAPSCFCASNGDIIPDGVFNVSDVLGLIDYVFSSGTEPLKDPLCPHINRADVNCDGVPDVLDVVRLIGDVFINGRAPCNPCDCNPYPLVCP